jgi:hypothetical protein
MKAWVRYKSARVGTLQKRRLAVVLLGCPPPAWGGEPEGGCYKCLGKRTDFLEDGGGGVGVEDVDALDATAGGFDFFAADDLVIGPVATLHEDVGKKSGDDSARSGFVEDEDGVDAFEAGENFGALVLRNDRAARSFEGANAVVAVDADDEEIAQGAGGFEAADVSGMKKIEAAVGEDNFAAVAFLGSKPQNRLFQSEYGIHSERAV